MPSETIHCFDHQVGDVNGDRIPDLVCLAGNKPFGSISPFVDHIALMVQDGGSMAVYRIPLQQGAGYNPTLFLGDFTGDGVEEMLVRIDSGGSGGMTFDYVYSFLHNQARKMFDSEQFYESNRYEVHYLDQYQVKVVSQNTGKIYLIDIRYKGSQYLSELYDSTGKLKAPVKGEVIAIGGLYPVDFDRNGTYELLAIQRIIGRYNADTLGYVMTALQWNGGKFAPVNQWVAISGA